MNTNTKILIAVGVIVVLVVAIVFLALGTNKPTVVLTQDEVNAAGAAKADQEIPAGTYLSFAANDPRVTRKLQKLGATNMGAEVISLPSGPGDACTVRITFTAQNEGTPINVWMEVRVLRGPNGELSVADGAKLKGTTGVNDIHLY